MNSRIYPLLQQIYLWEGRFREFKLMGAIVLVLMLAFLFGCGRAHPPIVFAPLPPEEDLPHLTARAVVVDDGNGGSEVVGYYASLAFDSRSNPHIAYYDFSNGRLKYARRSGGEFAVSVVDEGGDVGRYCSLKIDRDDLPHIVYQDRANNRVKYARMDSSGNWDIQVLTPNLETGKPGSWISLDLGLNPLVLHISYIEDGKHTLRYMRWAGFGEPEVYMNVDQGIGAGFSPVGGVIDGKTSIALDYNGIPRILYYDASNADLKLARYDPVGYDYPVWILEQVKKMRTRERLTGFEFNEATNGYRARLSFPSTQDKSETILKRFTGAFQSVRTLKRNEYNYIDEYTIEIPKDLYQIDYKFTIDYPRADVLIRKGDFLDSIYFEKDWDEGYWNDLKIEPRASGNYHVCFYNADLGDLYYGRWGFNEEYNGNAWVLETVDRGGFVGAYCSLGLREPAQNVYRPVIAYYDITGFEPTESHPNVSHIRFASREARDAAHPWQRYIVDLTGLPSQVGRRAGAWMNLAVAPNGTIGMVMVEVESNILLYGEVDYNP